MKILTIAIPSYNSMDYMRNCIEILIVDDGSKDETPAIADEYEAKYPGIIRAIHQENGGHGEAVNAGLRNATGFFYKVVDSDDWVDAESYQKILAFLKEAMKEEEPLDMLLSNYVYEKVGAKHKKVMEVGAGEFSGYGNIAAAYCDLQVGAGTIDIDQLDVQKLNADCGAGEIDMVVTGKEKDYNYDLSCGMGEIDLENSEYSGLGIEKTISNEGAQKDMVLECGMGEIDVEFTGEK